MTLTKHLCDSEFPWCPPEARSGEFYKLRVSSLSPTQFAVGKAEVQVRTGRMKKKFKEEPGRLHDGMLSVTDDGKEVLEEALFLASGAEARGLPGYRATGEGASRSRQ